MKLSTALYNFLNKKRTVEIQPAPEIEASNAAYLEEFSASIKKTLGACKAEDEEIDSVSEVDEGKDGLATYEEGGNSEETNNRGKGIQGSSPMDRMEMEFGDTQKSNSKEEIDPSAQRVKELEDDANIMCIRLFNLPYKLSSEHELVHFCDDLNITCEEARFDYNDAKEFSGSGRIWVRLEGLSETIRQFSGESVVTNSEEGEEGEEGEDKNDADSRACKSDNEKNIEKLREAKRSNIMKRIQGQDCGGRPVKAVRCGKDRGGETYVKYTLQEYEYSERYYDRLSSISVKCHACGKVGHLGKECDVPRKSDPCHLCAGLHDAYSCPSIVCYRCYEVGHHSKECLIPYKRLMNMCLKQALVLPSSQATILQSMCSHCGSRTHNFRFCPEVLLPPATYKSTNASIDDDPRMVCMVCGKRGGALCCRKILPPEQSSSLDLDWVARIGSTYLPSASDEARTSISKENVKREEKNTVTTGSDSMTLVYCPYCGGPGHHADYLASSSKHADASKQSKGSKCQGDLTRRMGMEKDRLQANRRLLTGSSSGRRRFEEAPTDSKIGSPGRALAHAHTQKSARGFKERIGRFSASPAAGGNNSDKETAQKRPRSWGSDDSEDSTSDENEEDEDSVRDYMSDKFFSSPIDTKATRRKKATKSHKGKKARREDSTGRKGDKKHMKYKKDKKDKKSKKSKRGE